PRGRSGPRRLLLAAVFEHDDEALAHVDLGAVEDLLVALLLGELADLDLVAHHDALAGGAAAVGGEGTGAIGASPHAVHVRADQGLAVGRAPRETHTCAR